MKTFAKKTTRIIFAFFMLLTTVACTQEDDINDIFEEREWTLTYIQEGTTQRYSNKKYNVIFAGNSQPNIICFFAIIGLPFRYFIIR